MINNSLWEKIFTSIPSHFVTVTLHQGQEALYKQQSREKDAQTVKAQRHFPSVRCARESMSKNEWKEKKHTKHVRASSASGHTGVLCQVYKYTRCLRLYGSSWKKFERHKQPRNSMQAAHTVERVSNSSLMTNLFLTNWQKIEKEAAFACKIQHRQNIQT